MKKYNKPTLNVEVILSENNIANGLLSSITTNLGGITHDENDINFESFWK